MNEIAARPVIRLADCTDAQRGLLAALLAQTTKAAPAVEKPGAARSEVHPNARPTAAA